MSNRDPLPKYDLLIDGKHVAPGTETYSTDIDPATERPIAYIAQGSAADVDRAVGAARAALPMWSGMRAAERGRILHRMADLMQTHQEELIALESLDGGKPLAGVRRQDVPAAIDTLNYYAGWADKINGQVIPARPGALTYTVREPVGVVAAIVPWNFPLMIGMWKIAPALACGCTLVVKPAELTPLSALRLAEFALEAGVPPGVFNVVTGKGSVVGEALVNHPDVDKVTFTGSPGVGRGIMKGAAGNFKRVSLELGGKSANLIFDDADLDAAVRAAASGIFFNAGQVCSAGSRILAQSSVYDEVVERLAHRAASIRVGSPKEAGISMGPLISAAQRDTVLKYVDIGAREGARLVAGGARVGNLGYFVAPTVFADVRHEMRISQEEIFGPVASVIRFEDEADAIRIANGTPFSLAADIASHTRSRPVRSGSTPMATRMSACRGEVRATQAWGASTATRRSKTSRNRRQSGSP
jgi:aldehyde dehydrogenase (NAD+)